MTSPVELYVYDLSNGMARQLSAQLTGRQIDGIWHTSIVVFGKEVFYGQGINTTLPGRSHHGAPLQIINMGETALDEDTFNEYLQEIKEHYTADKYHLLDFNCNSFTDDCVGFLTGGTIPSFIKDLPTDFLSTSFGAALRPTIDAMYRRPASDTAAPTTATNTSTNPQLAASILQAVASQAANGSARTNIQATNSLTSPLHVITNPTTFNNFLKTHKAAVAFFTSATCPPCRMIEPVFERLSEEKGLHEDRDGAGFAKIDIDVGMGRNLAAEWGIRATPTFIFFLDGKKLDELKGADANELRTQVDLLLFQAYPPHPHTSLFIPTVQALSLNPIIFSQVPAVETVVSKLSSFIDEASWPASASQSKDQTKAVLLGAVLPYLKARFPSPPPTDAKALPSVTPAILASWTQATGALAIALSVESLFPLVDMWRLAFLDPAVGSWLAALDSPTDPIISVFLPKAINELDNSDNSSSSSSHKGSRNYILTTLRMLCNAFSHSALSQKLLLLSTREKVTQVLVPSLLHSDALVRTAAASLAFDVSAVLQTSRVESVKSGRRGIKPYEDDRFADWEVEVVSAVVEALDREKENEEVVHRLTAALAFFLRLSPQYESQIKALLEVLQTRKLLEGKLVKGSGWDVDGGIRKKEIRKLVEEVAMKLCP